jgi:hypothetical protein
MITISDRSEYIGAHVRPEVKEAIKDASKRREMSISAWVADAVEGRLIAEGFEPKVMTDDGPKPLLDVAEAAE